MKTSSNILTNIKRAFSRIPISLRVRRIIVPLGVLAIGIFGFVLLISTRPQTKPADANETIWQVATKPAIYETYRPRVSAFGELRARREVDLRLQVAGDVLTTSKNFEEGARVNKGEVLLSLDPFNYQAAVDDAKAALAASRAMLVEADAATELAKLDLARTKTLTEKGQLSQKNLDDRRTDHTIKQARRDQQRAAVARGEVNLARAQRNLADTKLIAPFDGYLSAINAREGRVLTPNERVALLSDANGYDVAFNLSDADYGRFLLRDSEVIGRKLQVLWNIGGERVALTATIERVGARISQTTRGVDVFARLDASSNRSLRGGAFVEVHLESAPIENVIAIPKAATYGGKLIYLIENDRLVAHHLQSPIDAGDVYLIGAGIAQGKEIVLTRFNEAAPGVRVRAAPAP